MAFSMAFPWAVLGCGGSAVSLYDGAMVPQSGYSSYSGGADSGLETDAGGAVYWADVLTLTYPDGSQRIFRDVYYGFEGGFWTSHNGYEYVAPPYSYRASGFIDTDYICTPEGAVYSLSVGSSFVSDSGFYFGSRVSQQYGCTTGKTRITKTADYYPAQDTSSKRYNAIYLECQGAPARGFYTNPGFVLVNGVWRSYP